jgi:hypothetical protein
VIAYNITCLCLSNLGNRGQEQAQGLIDVYFDALGVDLPPNMFKWEYKKQFVEGITL